MLEVTNVKNVVQVTSRNIANIFDFGRGKKPTMGETSFIGNREKWGRNETTVRSCLNTRKNTLTSGIKSGCLRQCERCLCEI